MEYREFGRTGWKVSAIGFGAWPIGRSWGQIDQDEAWAALNRAVDLGVNFFDTADIYGSEGIIGRLLKARSERLYVATKFGRKPTRLAPKDYTLDYMTRLVEASLRSLGVDALDLVQLHTPPSEVFASREVFGFLDELVKQGKIRYYGVSVETIAEAQAAMQHGGGLASVQLIFNIFRQRPAEAFFHDAKAQKVAVIVRVPLASGLLTGKMSRETAFPDNDHRAFNREGQRFDRGETFSGVDYEEGLAAVEELRPLVPNGATMAQFALRWILMHDAVSTTIPGAKNPPQVEDNVRGADLPPLSGETMAAVKQVYDTRIKAMVHHLW